MSKHGKRIRKAREAVVRTKLYTLGDAVALVKANANAKFDETVELAINLGVDPKHADQMVRGVVNLPNGTGRILRVARRRKRPATPAPTSSARKTSSPPSRPARSSSIAASPPRT